MSIFTNLNNDASSIAVMKKLEADAVAELGLVRLTVVAASRSGDFQEHSELEAGQLYVSSTAKPSANLVSTAESDTDDNDVEVVWTPSELKGVTFSLDMGVKEVRNLHKTLMQRPTGLDGVARASEFQVLVYPAIRVGTTGTITVRVASVVDDSFTVPAGIVMTAAQQKEMVNKKREVSQGIRAEGIQRSQAARVNRGVTAQASLSDVVAEATTSPAAPIKVVGGTVADLV